MTCLHLQTLADTPLLYVTDVHCTAPRSGWGEEEAGQRPRLVLSRHGVFGWQTRDETCLVEAGCLLFLEPDQPYRFSHPADCGDDCTLIAFVPDLWQEAVGTRTVRRRARLAPARQYQGALFYRAAARHAYDTLALEELGLQLADALIDVLAEPLYRAASLSGPRAAVHHRRLAEAAMTCVSASYCGHSGLDSIARQVHSSPYHLARVFREQTGITLHRYRGHLRLAAALTALGDGCDDLADLAVRLGYASHGHFSGAFRAAFGCSPSAARDLLTRATLAQMRKILEAQGSSRM